MHKLPLLSLLFALLALGAPAGAESLTQTLPVSGPGRLIVELDRGSVEIVTHHEPNVHVSAEAHGLGASSVHFEVVRDGRDVVLRARTEAWLEWLSSGPRLSVHVQVPASFEVVCASDRALVTRRDAVEISYPTRAIGNATR
jgi:hypothetical protein